MLIALAGLPGTGKTSLCRELAPLLDAVALDKDAVRAALFQSRDIDYSDDQNDLCMEVIYQVAGYLLRRDPQRHVILDGRTFSRTDQVESLRQAARSMGTQLGIIECVCCEATARRRLDPAGQSTQHPAADRDEKLYERLKNHREPIDSPHLVLDTEENDPQECARLARDFVMQLLQNKREKSDHGAHG